MVIKVENLSKQYRLGQVGTGALVHDINRAWHRLRGKDDPYLKIGEENDRTSKGKDQYVWALRDINFSVNQGEVLGIIGRNGAGKSTLLKILSRTTKPTTGTIKAKGRIASLLEVGTGFHPELSGRDNVFLNGAILGMTRQEIKSKFDEIIDFAGVERYIDTPVKRYSSGMYVRLAFAVAAHLEPEILVVDEVLAVGDAEFQKKALGKMKDVSGREGRTVLFVSHNMGAVQSLCTKGIVLKNGSMIFEGKADDAIAKYLNLNSSKHIDLDLKDREDREGSGIFKFEDIRLFNEDGQQADSIFCNDTCRIALTYSHKPEIDLTKMIITVGFRDQLGELLGFFTSDEMGFKIDPRSKEIILTIPKLGLRPGSYNIWLLSTYETTAPENFADSIENAATVQVLQNDIWSSGKLIREGNRAFFYGTFSQ